MWHAWYGTCRLVRACLQVMMEFRNADSRHVDWVKALKQLFQQLKAYVKQHHMAGPSWNPGGIPLTDFKADKSASAAAKAGTLSHIHWHKILPTSQEPRSLGTAAADYDSMLYNIDFAPWVSHDVCAALCDYWLDTLQLYSAR